MHITIGKANCLNDTKFYLDNRIPHFLEKLKVSFDKQDYVVMKLHMMQLKRIMKDMDSMIDELDKLKVDPTYGQETV